MSTPQDHQTSNRQAYQYAADALVKAVVETGNPSDSSGATLTDLRRHFSDELRSLALKEIELSAQESKESIRSKMKEEFCRILKHPQVVGVNLATEPRRLVVNTKELLCEHPKTHDLHSIGEFEINIAFENASGKNPVSWINKTRRVVTLDGPMEAPHVFEGGYPCLGNMEGKYEELITRGEYFAALEMAIVFIESVNINDNWGKFLPKWPVAGRR